MKEGYSLLLYGNKVDLGKKYVKNDSVIEFLVENNRENLRRNNFGHTNSRIINCFILYNF
jgi:hypothetical protein